jgi:hypothetical protein
MRLLLILALIALAPSARAQSAADAIPNMDLGPLAHGVISNEPSKGRPVSTITTGSSNAARRIAATYPESARRAAEQAFTQLLATYPQVEQALGAKSGDAAVATAVMLIASYEAHRDADVDEASVKKVIAQVRTAMQSSPGFVRASPATRRDLFEQMAILGLFVAGTKASLAKDPDAATERALRAAAKSYLAVMTGGDPDQLEITSAGLAMRSEPSSDGESPAAEVSTTAGGHFDNKVNCVVNVSLGRQYHALSESFEYTYERWVLFEDGSVYDGLPSIPLTDFDAAASKKKQPKAWGTWKMKGRALTVVWTGIKDRKPRTYTDWFRLEVPKAGAKLSGLYVKAGFVQQNLGAETTFSASGWSTMVFRKDGEFSFAKGGSSSYSGAGGSVHARDRSESDGTYTIDGPLLTMKYRDGNVFRASLFLSSKDEKIIFVNGKQYMRR